ncbi:hypothetical protein F0L68_34125 [Solihabitans fulvus]|uniref:Uncharacterized protein n=1 Tax=Solihabitans fulvus TaxID=1892852 RepID=A0A5B2WQK2_9PSEU|nr:hypothetical protein [Solihabitans fulvus]KAA2252806.1 hypothetical protein F0L68_34125 [Solihabitans fulvus]
MKFSPLARTAARVAALAALGVGSMIAVAGPASAESAPGCSSTTQIGSTAYITVNGETAASVKQFKGCGKNWAYTYVWSGYRSNHSYNDLCTSVVSHDGSGGHLVDLQCGGANTVEIWSSGADTLNVCTTAIGFFPDVAAAETSQRC